MRSSLRLRADAFVEIDGLADALFERKTARAEGLRICGCRRVRGGVAGERPELFDFVLLDPHHAGADGRGEELVQAGAEVVAVQVGDFEVHQAKGVRAVGDNFDVVRVGHVGDLRARAWSGLPS